jgi:type IV pilus assembly protein PilM
MANRLLNRIGFKKTNEVVGVDIGATSIKMCLLQKAKEGSFSLTAMAQRSYEEDLLHDGSIIDSSFVARELKSMMGANSIKARLAASALSSYSVITKRVSMPVLEREALEESIRIEVENIIPFPLNEIYYSHYAMGMDEEKEGMMNLLIVAAKKEIVDEYVSTFEQAGLDLAVLDVDIFAVTNLVESIYKPKGFSVLAADVGASVTNIAIVKDPNIEFTREILIGGKYVTSEFARSENLTYKEAEERKLGQSDEAEPFLQDFVSNVSSEINKTINFYVATKPRETVGRIYLAGGASRVAGLKAQIEKETGVEVEFLNPFLFLKDGGPEDMDEARASSAAVALYLSTRREEN